MRRGWLIALALLLMGGIGAYIWYNRLKNNALAEGGPQDGTLKPRLEVGNVSITNISDDAIDLNMALLVDNPLPVAFKAHRLDYSLYIAGEEVLKDSYRKPIAIESQDSTTIRLPAKLLVKKFGNVLKRLEAKGIDSTDYTVRSTFELDVPILGERTFKVTSTKKLPTYYLPEIKVNNIDLGKVGLKRTDLAANVSVVNKNKFPYNITDTHYSVLIDGKLISEGDQPEPILIKKQATTPVVLPLTAKPGNALSVVDEFLFEKETTPYVVNFRCKIIDKENNASFSNSQLNTQIKGTLADFKRIADKAAAKKDAERAAEKEERQEKREERQEQREERKEERQERREARQRS